MSLDLLQYELRRQEVLDSFEKAGLSFQPTPDDPFYIGVAEMLPPGWYAVGRKVEKIYEEGTSDMAKYVPLIKVVMRNPYSIEEQEVVLVCAMESQADPAVFGRWPVQPPIKGEDDWAKYYKVQDVS